MMRTAAGLVVAASVLLLVACGEKPQISKTAGNDVAPYQGAANEFVAAGWKPGDRTSWELSLKARAQNTQNEYSKTR